MRFVTNDHSRLLRYSRSLSAGLAVSSILLSQPSAFAGTSATSPTSASLPTGVSLAPPAVTTSRCCCWATSEVVFEQQIYRAPDSDDRGIGIFARASGAPAG